jgi:hypothetical protein
MSYIRQTQNALRFVLSVLRSSGDIKKMIDIKYKIIIGAVVVIVLWYILRESLISLNLYIESSDFAKRRLANKKKHKFKFRDPLAAR